MESLRLGGSAVSDLHHGGTPLEAPLHLGVDSLGSPPLLAEHLVSEPLLPLEGGALSRNDSPLGECVDGLLIELGLGLDGVGLYDLGLLLFLLGLCRRLLLLCLCYLRCLGGLVGCKCFLPVLDGLGSDSGQGLDDLLRLRLVVDGLFQLVHGGDSDRLELGNVCILEPRKVLELFHGHSFTL